MRRVRMTSSKGSTMIRMALLLSTFAACAVAEPPGNGAQDANGRTDAAIAGDGARSPDASSHDGSAPPADAAQPVTITLSQTPTTTLAASSLACADSENDTTDEQAYYRVFDIAAMGVIGPLALSSIAFGVQSEDGTQTITVNVGTYSAAPGTTLDVGSSDSDDWAAGDVTAIASTTTQLTSGATGTIVSVPITAAIPASSRLIVEVRSPNDSSKTDVAFFMGASSGAETTPGFFWAPTCQTAPPTTPAGLGEGAVPFLITATGTYTP
jgi:hypothetical protein